MKTLLRELRILPVVMVAAGCLLALKVFGIALDGGYILSNANDGAQTEIRQADPDPVPTPVETMAAAPSPVVQNAKMSWAQEVFGFPDTTGSVPEAKPVEKKEGPNANAVNPPRSGPDGKVVPLDAPRQPSAGERAVLERLQERRQELEAREREIDIRENLLKATEKRIESKAQEIKETETRGTTVTQEKKEAEVSRFKGIATMYENMKAKDAAKVFDRLEMKVLIEIASQINPRRMADILAQMQPESAERLTVEMASRATAGDKSLQAGGLPKIEGKPNGS